MEAPSRITLNYLNRNSFASSSAIGGHLTVHIAKRMIQVIEYYIHHDPDSQP
jgi:hypothetical protein